MNLLPVCRVGLRPARRRDLFVTVWASPFVSFQFRNRRRVPFLTTTNLQTLTTIARTMSCPTPPAQPDYTSWNHPDLIARITDLESQLRAQTAAYRASRPPKPPGPSKRSLSPSRRASPFDPSKYSTRHIALKFAYLGARYNGYEHANGTVTPLPTVEEVLWCALRKSRLISPLPSSAVAKGDGGGGGESMEVLWDTEARIQRGALDLSWEGCQYSKCGRTDRGVSAFGQVVGVRVRSNRPLVKAKDDGDVEIDGNHSNSTVVLDSDSDGLPDIDVDDLASDKIDPAFHSINDELPYITILNSILPSDLRILAWCPHPPPDFDARFSCRERRYRYFFTNPAFMPTPGPLGFQNAAGKRSERREGFLDIQAMSEAAKKLEGLHDFRNLCKIDPSKQMTSCERRITFAGIEEVEQQGGPVSFNYCPDLHGDADHDAIMGNRLLQQGYGPQVYSFTVHGSAFLWHQVRCMAAILFLVGQGLESPSVVDELLDVASTPGRPMYEMASDTPLVLWDCIYPQQDSNSTEDQLDWIYAGDDCSIPALTIKSDGKFGMGGVVDELWTQWRKHKMNEILSASLLDLVISQGDGSPLRRGGFQDTEAMKIRSQKLFDGRETPRMAGKYAPVMQKPRMASLEVQNEKYRAGKGTRREAQRNPTQEFSSED